MEEMASIVVILFIIFILVIIGVIGLAAIVAIAAVLGMGYLLYKLAAAFLEELEKIHQEQERVRLVALDEQKVRAQKALEATQEDERLRREQLRQEQEYAARQQLEADRDHANKILLAANGGLLIQKPSAQQIDALIETGASLHAHCGKFLHVIVVVGSGGVSLEWKAHTGGGGIPQVIGIRGHDEMFRESALAGRHTARLPVGRHILAFRIKQADAEIASDDLAFEIFVPVQESLRAPGNFKKAVNAAASRFVEKAQTVTTAKKKVEDVLAVQGLDEDQITLEMSKLDVEIRGLQQDGA